MFNTGDDTLIPLTPQYLSGQASVNLTLPTTMSSLPIGQYRLQVRSSEQSSIHDLAGNALDGDNNGVAGGDYVRTFSVLENHAPTDILLSQNSINENLAVGSVVGTLSGVDVDPADTLTLSLVSGTGSDNNSDFVIEGNLLKTTRKLDFETTPLRTIRVRVQDAVGAFYEEQLTIQVGDLPELVAAPIIGDGTSQRSLVDRVVLTFDGPLTIDADAFLLTRRGASGSIPVTATQSTNGTGQTVLTLTFSGDQTRGAGALVDGYYQLVIDGTKIRRGTAQLDVDQDGVGGDSKVIGAVESDAFFALFGDTNGDAIVGVAEFGAFRNTFGKTQPDPNYRRLFDYEMDGTVGIADFGQFRNRFGKAKMQF